MPRYRWLLLVENAGCGHWFAVGVGAFGRLCQRLAVLGNNIPTRHMVFPTGLFYFKARRIRIHPFDGKGVKRSSRGRVFLAIVLEGVAEIDSRTVRHLSRPCHLSSTVRCCLPYIGLALDSVGARRLGFGGIELPGSSGTVSPKHPDGGDGYADRHFCYDASHSFSVLSDFDFSPKAVRSAAADWQTASLVGDTTLRPIAPTAIPSISRGGVYHVRRPARSAELFRGIVPVAAK